LFNKAVDAGAPQLPGASPPLADGAEEEGDGGGEEEKGGGKKPTPTPREKRERSPWQIARAEVTKLLNNTQAKVRTLQGYELDILRMPDGEEKTYLNNRQAKISNALHEIVRKLSVALALKERATAQYLDDTCKGCQKIYDEKIAELSSLGALVARPKPKAKPSPEKPTGKAEAKRKAKSKSK